MKGETLVEQKSNKKWFKRIILITILVLIILTIESIMPTYKKYDLASEEIEIKLLSKTLKINNEEEIEEVIKLINNGNEGTQLVFKEYNRGFNKLIKRTEEPVHACVLNYEIKFDTVVITICSGGHGYIYDKDSKREIIVSEETVKYLEEISKR